MWKWHEDEEGYDANGSPVYPSGYQPEGTKTYRSPRLTEEPSEETTKPTCFNHTWKLYTGLQETFEYCSVCDTKRADKES